MSPWKIIQYIAYLLITGIGIKCGFDLMSMEGSVPDIAGLFLLALTGIIVYSLIKVEINYYKNKTNKNNGTKD